MTVIPPEEFAPLAAEILSGRRRLISWGGDLDAARVNHWQCPLPIDHLTDANWYKWNIRIEDFRCPPPTCLELENADQVAVVTHYYLGQTYAGVKDFLERIPGLRHFVPTQLSRALQADTGIDDLALLDEVIFGYGGLRDNGDGARKLLAAAPLGPHHCRARRLIEEVRRNRRLVEGKRVALFIEQMNPGGAERQICALAIGLRRKGWDVTLVNQRPWPQDAAHYRQSLEGQGIHTIEAPPLVPSEGVAWGPHVLDMVGREAGRLIWHLPHLLVPGTLALCRVLADIRPDLLVCYLDRPNLIGGVAGCLTGVPNILMSGRNLNPCHFPNFYRGQLVDFHEVYSLLEGLAGVRLSANSRRGAESYADWLGRPVDDIPVIPNGVIEEAFQTGTPALRQAVKQLSGIPPDRRILLGVFRLSEEKNPHLFVEVAARLLAEYPDLHAVVCGGGALEGSIRADLRQRGIEAFFTLLSGVSAMPPLMRASSLLLHTSRAEGTPNALLEAQAAGLPIVCTQTGGSEDCLSPAARPHAHPQGETEALVASCRQILADPAEARRLIRAGRAHVRRHHSLDTLATATLAPFAPSTDR